MLPCCRHRRDMLLSTAMHHQLVRATCWSAADWIFRTVGGELALAPDGLHRPASSRSVVSPVERLGDDNRRHSYTVVKAVDGSRSLL